MKLTCWDPNKQKIFEKLRDTGPLSRQNRVAVKQGDHNSKNQALLLIYDRVDATDALQ